MTILRICSWIAPLFLGICGCGDSDPAALRIDEVEPPLDMLTPAYYTANPQDPFKNEVDEFLSQVHEERFHHPLEDPQSQQPVYSVPLFGVFGARKGSSGSGQHHPAVDLKVNGGETTVSVFAAHDGRATTVRDAPKYRQYLAIEKDVVDGDGRLIGKLVTIYAHLDLDLDEADGLLMDGQDVEAGDLLSAHLFAGTVGGPHLHFEIRYYRPEDTGEETYYGSAPPVGGNDLTLPSAGGWSYGFWNPEVGYGFGHPLSHGLIL